MMVLEQPGTYAAADNAAKHFDDLDAAYREMQTAAQKHQALVRLPELDQERVDALADEQLIDTFGATRDGDTPLLLWKLRTRDRLLDAATEAAVASQRQLKERCRTARGEHGRLDTELATTRAELARAGGAAIDRLKADIQTQRTARENTLQRRARFDEKTAVLGIDPAATADFQAARLAAEQFQATLEPAQREIADEQQRLSRRSWPDQVRLEELEAERDSLSGRSGRVPRRLHEARLTMAGAAHMDPGDLQFVAELIDIAPGEQHWRKAAEVTLYSIARILLVDDGHLQRLSSAIDPIRLPVRIQFQGVATRPHVDSSTGNPDFVSGKLVYKESPFSWWIRERVTRRGTDHLCVELPADLDGDGPRVTQSGQTRNGRRGAHGELTDASIIGFSSADRLAEIDNEVDAIRERLGKVGRREHELTERGKRLSRLSDAHKWVLATEWSDIDVASIENQLSARQRELDQLLQTEDILAALAVKVESLEKTVSDAHAEVVRANDALEDIEKEHARLCEQQDETSQAIDRIETNGTVALDDDQRGYLDEVFAELGSPDSLSDFDRDVSKLRSRLADRSLQARKRAADATTSLVSIFEQFQARWPDPNRGVTIDSYSDYRAILDKIVATGLAERRHEWRRRLSEWSGQDLVPLSGAFGAALDEIRARLDPVNDILDSLPFGPANDRLHIALRVLQSDDVARFRRQLVQLASGVTDDVSDDDAEHRFLQLRAFIALIRKPDDDARAVGVNRDAYLDVRRHVEITAVRIDAQGRELATYASLGGKSGGESGGESQELMAFIVGAALRYQLGDEQRRPRFAPVFLDEGFIKADSEFAGRAVQAWKKLGFQLIIAVPLDKVTALEPAMPLILTISKSANGYSHVTRLRGIESPGENGNSGSAS